MRKLMLTLIAVLMIGSAQATGTPAPAAAGAAPSADLAAPSAAGSALMAPSAAAMLSPAILDSLCSSRVRDRTRAISALKAKNDERALTLLQALRDGRLYYDRASCELYLKSDQGYTVWATGASFTGSGLRRSGVSAQQRADITAFISAQALHAPDAAARLAAVTALAQDPYGKITLAEVTSLMQHEDDPEVYAQLEALNLNFSQTLLVSCTKQPNIASYLKKNVASEVGVWEHVSGRDCATNHHAFRL